MASTSAHHFVHVPIAYLPYRADYVRALPKEDVANLRPNATQAVVGGRSFPRVFILLPKRRRGLASHMSLHTTRILMAQP